MTDPDPRAPSSVPGSGAPRRSRLESLAREAVGAAWTATGPIRWGAGLAVRASEAAVSEVAARAFPRPAPAPGPVVATTPPTGSAGVIDRMLGPVRPVIDAVVRVALEGLDLTRVVLDKVDLDTVVAAVDLDSAVGGVDLDAIVERVDIARIIGRLDLDAIIESVDLDAIIERVAIDRIIDRLDLDAIVARVDLDAIVGHLDLDAIVEQVDIERIIGRLDLDAIVERVDIERIVGRLDLDAIVERVAIDRIIARLDLDAIVQHVDIDAIVARVDFEAAIAKIDIIRIAEEVVEGIDLAGIIRDSTGTLASEAVHGVRVQGQHADDAIGQFVGRMLGRRRQLDGSPLEATQAEQPATPNQAPPQQVRPQVAPNGQYPPPPSDRNQPR